jgi:hypothetical protein
LQRPCQEGSKWIDRAYFPLIGIIRLPVVPTVDLDIALGSVASSIPWKLSAMVACCIETPAPRLSSAKPGADS